MSDTARKFRLGTGETGAEVGRATDWPDATDELDIDLTELGPLEPAEAMEPHRWAYLGVPEQLFGGHPPDECQVIIDTNGDFLVIWQPPSQLRVKKRTDPKPALPLCDLKVLMERPFYALSKTRQAPITYVSPDRELFVNVHATSSAGLATIWDADILIYLISRLRQEPQSGASSPVRVRAHDVLTAMGRGTGGRHYALLRGALIRLQGSRVETNIGGDGRKGERTCFSLIKGWAEDEGDGQGRSQLAIALPNWILEAASDGANLLAITPNYLQLTGGRARWLYRVARKHAGGNGTTGWSGRMRMLHLKSGADGTFARFAYEIRQLVAENALPEFNLELRTNAHGEEEVHMAAQDPWKHWKGGMRLK